MYEHQLVIFILIPKSSLFMKFSIFIVCVVVLFTAQNTAAQIAGLNNTPTAVRTNGQGSVMNADKEDTRYVYRHPQRLSALYTGYAIEILQIRLPLEASDPLFRQFGNLFYEKIGRGKSYSYIFTTTFIDKRNLERYYHEVVLPKAPSAKIVYYEGGRRA